MVGLAGDTYIVYNFPQSVGWKISLIGAGRDQQENGKRANRSDYSRGENNSEPAESLSAFSGRPWAHVQTTTFYWFGLHGNTKYGLDCEASYQVFSSIGFRLCAFDFQHSQERTA
jgi:hypothetical protein